MEDCTAIENATMDVVHLKVAEFYRIVFGWKVSSSRVAGLAAGPASGEAGTVLDGFILAIIPQSDELRRIFAKLSSMRGTVVSHTHPTKLHTQRRRQ